MYTFRSGFEQYIDALAFNAGHGGDLFGTVFAIEHKYRIDQIVSGEYIFAHQAA
ncbi:hypothetical protein D3C86_2220440 [compost metagenome]